MFRVQTSFQDTPGDGYYSVLYYGQRKLEEQLQALGLANGDTILLWEPDCPGYEVQAELLFDFHHPMTSGPMLWARAGVRG